MDETKVYLSYYDVMILMFEFEEVRQENQDFVGLLVEQFNNYFIEQVSFNVARGMQFKIPDIVLKNLKIYPMAISLYNMLVKLTGVDLEDKKLRKYYKNYINSYEEYISNSQLLENYKKLIKKKSDN